jgi:hypothetical protein
VFDLVRIEHLVADAPSPPGPPSSHGGPYRATVPMPAVRRPGLVLSFLPEAARAAAEGARYLVEVPQLRHRKEDLHALCAAELVGIDRPDLAMALDFEIALLHYDFPGDIGELKQVVRSSVQRCSGSCLGAEHLPEAVKAAVGGLYR